MRWDLDGAREPLVATSDDAAFVERAHILHDTMRTHAALPPGVRQGRVIQELCERVPLAVRPGDVLLGRVAEQLATPEDRAFIEEHSERHGDLLVRVTGFSEYFVRLLPEVQEELIRRCERGSG